MFNLKSFASVCRPDSGWAAFFTSILVWGVGMGCFQAVFNNFITVFYALFGGWVFDRYGAGALNRLLDGFDGNLTSSKWAKICKVSADTALIDIKDLVGRGILVQSASGGRSTNYELYTNKDDR